MKDFFLLEQDLRAPGSASVGELPEDMDAYDWICGKKMPTPKSPLRLPLAKSSGDYRGDMMSGLLTLFSDELKAALEMFAVTNVDYYPVELQDLNNGEIEDGYWLANIIGRIECVDKSKSTIRPRPAGGKGQLFSFYIDADATRGSAIFRLNENPALIIINEALRNHLIDSELVGVRMRRTQDYDGW